MMVSRKTTLVLVLAVAVCLLHYSQAGDSNGEARGLLSFFFGKPRTCNCLCGRPNRVDGRLQGGEFSQAHEFPWLVAIILNGTRVASGALINDRYIITANGPLNGLTPYQVKVTLGAYDRCRMDITSVNDSISSITVLPNYDVRRQDHDIALLKLTNPVTFSQNINPVCLPDANARYLGQVATVVSWGQEPNTTSNVTNTPNGRRRRDTEGDCTKHYEDDGFCENANSREGRQAILPSNNLCLPKKLGLPVLGEGRCPNDNVNSQQISGDTGCAGISGAPNQVCSTDAGAPVQFRDQRGVYQLIGVISANNGCVNSTLPTLYTRINSYVSWIHNNTRDTCYCSSILKFGL